MKSKRNRFHVFFAPGRWPLVCVLDQKEAVFTGFWSAGGCLVTNCIISSEGKNVYAYNKQDMLIVY
jgi:hypothetical protein